MPGRKIFDMPRIWPDKNMIAGFDRNLALLVSKDDFPASAHDTDPIHVSSHARPFPKKGIQMPFNGGNRPDAKVFQPFIISAVLVRKRMPEVRKLFKRPSAGRQSYFSHSHAISENTIKQSF